MVFEKEKIKKAIEKWLKFLFNPRLILCLAIGWIITNGWCYAFIGVGTLFDISWMLYIGGAYLAFLWVLPTPEKIITVIIAIFLLKRLFPNDTKTLAVLLDMKKKIKDKIAEIKGKGAAKKELRKQQKEEKKRQKSTNP